MLAEPFSAFANHLLAPAAWARETLAEHAGKVAVFELFPMQIAVTADAEGMLHAAAREAQPAVTIRLSHANLLLILSDGEAALRKADIEGDTGFASAIAKVAANLEWDVEEDLSRVFGDVGARRMTSAGRSAAAWPRQAAVSLAGSVAEYLTEEKHLLVTPLQAAEFVRDVDELRDAVERLDKRIERLQRPLRGD
ncbi:MAG: SCP2 sterol-binding domain-containing protein [Betaproteobacteria bacterium]|jgi:ubiquinone biosynthesis protein UbiJ